MTVIKSQSLDFVSVLIQKFNVYMGFFVLFDVVFMFFRLVPHRTL